MDELARPWQRLLLPGGMLEGDGGRRTARDWVVDVVMFFVAVGLGGAVLTDTWPNHAGWTRALDIIVGTAACLALWVRRRHPVGVAVSTVVASMFFALAGGAGLMALFNAAIPSSAACAARNHSARARGLSGLSCSVSGRSAL